MSTKTAHTRGLEKPHKAEAPKKGIGSGLANARSIGTEQSKNKMKSTGGVAHTYFANSRDCRSTEK